MPRSSNTAERRQQIARAFLKVMAHAGYDGASINEVARRAKLAPGLVHYHFENKLEILLEAMGELLSEHAALLETELIRAAASGKSASGAPLAELAAFLDVHLGLGEHSNPDALVFWVQLGGEALREKKVAQALSAALTATAGRLTDILQRGAVAGVFPALAPPASAQAAGAPLTAGAPLAAGAAAAALLATIEGYFFLATAARPLIPAGSAAPCALRMAEGLLGCKLSPRSNGRAPPSPAPRPSKSPPGAPDSNTPRHAPRSEKPTTRPSRQKPGSRKAP